MGATDLKGVTAFGESTITNDIRENVVAFFEWGILNKGGFVNVELSDSGVYGGNSSTLRPVNHPHYSAGQVWETHKANWVWQSGLSPTPSPLVANTPSYPGVSGVYVGSTFYAAGTTGTYSHVLDHENGRVVFNTAIPTGSLVQCEHSYKYVNITISEGLPWFKEIQQRSERIDTDFLSTSGSWSQFPRNRVQLPAIGVEITPNREMVGYQLGGGHYVYTDVLFHCIAEDVYMRDALMDTVNLQNQKTINMFSLNSLADSGTFPLNESGVPASGALRYPDLTTTYPGGTMYFKDMSIDSIYSFGNVHVATVKCTTEIVLGV